MSQVTIAGGKRQSTAVCYLDPARGRPNLVIEQGAMAEALILEGKRCVGVRYSVDGARREARAAREVIVSRRLDQFAEAAGTIRHRAERIAPLARHRAGSTNCAASARICAIIIRRVIKFAIAARNTDLQRQCARLAARARGDEIRAVRHRLPGLDRVPVRIYFRTREGLETPDATISILPFLYEMVGRQRRVAKRQGITMNANVLRSESTGSIHIKSADPGRTAGDPVQFSLDRA